MTEADVVELVRDEIRLSGSLRALARHWVISPTYLSRVLSGGMHPGKAILDHLGLQRVVTYRMIGREYVSGYQQRSEKKR